MAILDHAHVKVEVITGDVAAPEFDNEDIVDEDPDTVSKYIETEGGDFYIKITLLSTFDWRKADTIVCHAVIDGDPKLSRSICMLMSNFSAFHGLSLGMKGVWSGTGEDAQLLQYTFGDLSTRDQLPEDSTKIWTQFGELGTLQITLNREHHLGSGGEGTSVEGSLKKLEDVPEKVLKGKPIHLVTTLRPINGMTRPSLHITELIEEKPFAKFKFYYRTRRALQSLMVIDRSPTPIPLEERGLENLTSEKLVELEHRSRARNAVKAEQNPIKAEPTAIKRERADSARIRMPPLKTARGPDGKTVYIIDSDDDDAEDDDGEVVEVPQPRRPTPGEGSSTSIN